MEVLRVLCVREDLEMEVVWILRKDQHKKATEGSLHSEQHDNSHFHMWVGAVTISVIQKDAQQLAVQLNMSMYPTFCRLLIIGPTSEGMLHNTACHQVMQYLMTQKHFASTKVPEAPSTYVQAP